MQYGMITRQKKKKKENSIYQMYWSCEPKSFLWTRIRKKIGYQNPNENRKKNMRSRCVKILNVSQCRSSNLIMVDVFFISLFVWTNINKKFIYSSIRLVSILLFVSDFNNKQIREMKKKIIYSASSKQFNQSITLNDIVNQNVE